MLKRSEWLPCNVKRILIAIRSRQPKSKNEMLFALKRKRRFVFVAFQGYAYLGRYGCTALLG